MKAIKKLNKKFESAYEALVAITNYFDNADDLGWAAEVKTIDGMAELYWIMSEELDNGGYFSDWAELMADKFAIPEAAQETCAKYNERIGCSLFNPNELTKWYQEED